MKLNRFVALAMIAFLAIGAMGFVSTRSFAKAAVTGLQQVQAKQADQNKPSLDINGGEDPSTGPDTDTIQEQVGDQVGGQVEDGQPDGVETPGNSSGSSTNQSAPQGMSSASGAAALANPTGSLTLVNAVKAQPVSQGQNSQPEGTETPGTNVGPDEQNPKYSSSIVLDQALTDGMSEADEAATLADQAKISVEQAKAAALAANSGTAVVKAELGDENGALIYSVELSNGSDVKVDAGNGAILQTDTGGDNEG
jgi:hypothetical protein